MGKKDHFRETGFTLTEICLIIAFFGIMIVFAIPTFSAGLNINRIRESEVKANTHTIQVAIERYYVDQNKYPPFLLGGDANGWRRWHLTHDEPEVLMNQPSNRIVNDVLIAYGYLESYPMNPFVRDGMDIIKSTHFPESGDVKDLKWGDGDPRFGYKGDVMGNGLDDPAYYQHRIVGIPEVETSFVETSRTLDKETVIQLEFCEPPVGLHYMMGGRKKIIRNGRENKVVTVATWWPGNFFYRGLHEFPG
jgi:type II secretory pathway pseudopilin PulG